MIYRRKNSTGILLGLVLLLLSTLFSCDDDSTMPPSQWLYFGIVSEEPLYFSKIYVPDGPVIYRDTTYEYSAPDYGISEYNSFKLPLSPFSDSVSYIFEQPDRTDTIKVAYRQGPEYTNPREGILYLFRDHQIYYTTFENLVICDRCYRSL